MHFRRAGAALLGFSSLAASAPTAEKGLSRPVERGLEGKSRADKRSPLAVIQEVPETTVVVVDQNLGTIAEQQRIIEQEFGQLVQAQLALVSQLQTIKNNIRINHFKARFGSVNTVIVTVQSVVDQRQGKNKSQNRYLVNQILADNGKPESQIMVMVSDAATMTIPPNAAPSGVAADAVSGASLAAAPTQTAAMANYDQTQPLGSQLNQNVLLPINAQSPKVNQNQVFVDPAAIILPNQNNLFVEDSNQFLGDCVQQAAFFQLAGAQIFGSFQQLAQAQAGSVVIIDGSNGQAQQGQQQPPAASSAAAVAAPPAATAAAPPATSAAPPAAAAPASQGGFITLNPAPTAAAPPAASAPAASAPAAAAPAATDAAAAAPAPTDAAAAAAATADGTAVPVAAAPAVADPAATAVPAPQAFGTIPSAPAPSA